MLNLTKPQKLHLKRLVHHLKPVIIIGAQELSASVHQETARALEDHELIKIRINANNAEQRKQLVETLCNEHQAVLIHSIGHVIAIYKPSEKLAKKGKSLLTNING